MALKQKGAARGGRPSALWRLQPHRPSPRLEAGDVNRGGKVMAAERGWTYTPPHQAMDFPSSAASSFASCP